jgi:hypothetical protein
MMRLFRWLGVCAFLGIPFVLVLGRQRPAPCIGACDPQATGPGWIGPMIFALVLLGLAMLIGSALLHLEDR